MPFYRIYTMERDEIRDSAGIEVPDTDALRTMVVRYASEVLADTGDRIFERHFEVRVTDDDGLMLFTILVAGIEAPAIPRR